MSQLRLYCRMMIAMRTNIISNFFARVHQRVFVRRPTVVSKCASGRLQATTPDALENKKCVQKQSQASQSFCLCDEKSLNALASLSSPVSVCFGLWM